MSTLPLFGWFVTSERKKVYPNVDQLTKNLFVAMRDGHRVSVPEIGTPLVGHPGTNHTCCGCGVTLRKGIGYCIKDITGTPHIVDAIAIHHVACHRNKLDQREWKLLRNLPKATIPDEKVEILWLLGRHYNIF